MENSGGSNKPVANTESPQVCPMCESGEISFLAGVKGYKFWSCGRCEFVFCPEITPDYLSKLYEEGYHGPEDGAPKKGWSKDSSFLNPAFDLLTKKEHLKILDFGTGQNAVPDGLREKGHRVIAVDIAAPIRPHPDRLTGDLIELDLEPDQFDLSFSFQVFEHLPQPRALLEELFRLTRPGGLILIHTDMETADREGGFENWWYVAPPDHCVFYRNRTFEVFLDDQPHELLWKDATSVIFRKKSREVVNSHG